MNPLSPCTTPFRLMAPISRHFLPELQLEPFVWLTTGLIKGSRRPFAAYFVSGGSDCSFSAFGSAALAAAAAPATVCLAEGFTFGTTGATFGLELTRIVAGGAFFAAALI